MGYMSESVKNLLPTDAANYTRAEREADEERWQRMYDAARNTDPLELLAALAAKQDDKPADHFSHERTPRTSMFARLGPAWTLGRELKDATRHRIAQSLAIAALASSRMSGESRASELGKLTHDIAAVLARFDIGRTVDNGNRT